ncbi:MAG: acyl-CoA synthetase [Acidobacteria bacterium]|nr:acyl-CoA synthetase [Acidobacteriota bacterium]MCA1611726.1 acyl-CoA synthetase [Acidobacteriota bacterium]
MRESAAARLFSHLSARSGGDAVVFAGRTLTFGDLESLSRRYASGLAALGVRKGDRVAAFAESLPEAIVAMLGHYRLGAIHVPINTRYRGEEAGHILEDAGAATVVVRAGSESEAVLRSLPGKRRVIVIGGDGGPGAVSFESLLESSEIPGDPPVGDGDPAVIIYTSGTTGKSKGAALSYRALVANIGALTRLWRFSEADRLALTLPLFHVHGLCIGVHGALLSGAAILLFERFDAAKVVRSFADQGATIFMGVPTMYVRLLELLDERPELAASLARGRLFTSGSAALPAAHFEEFQRRTGHRILERYGMTETLFTLSNPYEGERRPGTVGLPVPGCDVRIVEENGQEAGEDAPGEVLVRGDSLMTGYWGKPPETAAAFRDGWFSTGDIARRDAAGYVSIVGRKSVDVIKSGGFKISAREIEDVLREHPRVREVAVVGQPDPVWGERIVAAVVLRDQSAPVDAVDTAELLNDLAAFTGESLADYKRLRAVCVLRELPRNAMGKVQKHRILEVLGKE